MKIQVPTEKAKEIDACAARVSELLRFARTLDANSVPDSVKNLSVFRLDGTPVRVKNMLSNKGVCTLWELTHFDMENSAVLKGFSTSSQRIVELEYAIKEAVDILKGSS